MESIGEYNWNRLADRTECAINSKNYTEIPEETRLWFEQLAEFLLESSKLSQQGEHHNALTCFNILFDCINDMESGKEIIFADEYGMWMLPIHLEPCLQAYIHSAAAMLNPEKYVASVLPLIRDYSYLSTDNTIKKKALQAANKAQQTLLKKELTKNGMK